MGPRLIANSKAKELVENIGNEVRLEAMDSRLNRAIKLVLESFSYEHVFVELLQNADDCEQTTTARIEVTDKAVFFTHNGKPFDEHDLRAICDIGVTTKRPDSHIGFMGIGFKAAFKLSDTPYVFSGPLRFSFSREEVIVPHWVDSIPDEVQKRLSEGVTLFYLPLRKDFPTDIVESFAGLLHSTFQPVCLVFLRRIKRLEIVGAGVRALQKDTLNKRIIRVTETIDANEKTYDFYEFRRKAKIPETAKADPRAKDSKNKPKRSL
jgi:hypothetical protein